MVSGPVFKKIKGKVRIFILFGGEKWKKHENVGRNRSNLGLQSSRLVEFVPLGGPEKAGGFLPWKARKTMGKKKIDFPLFFLAFQPKNPPVRSGPPRGICSSGESSGDLNLTDFVPHFHVFFVPKCVFLQFFRFFAIRIASWQPRTLPGRKISKFSSTGWS